MVCDGVSVITVTKRFNCISNVYKNYNNQNIKEKELIIVINKDDINFNEYYEYFSILTNVYVYVKPESTTLGECLNFATTKAKFNIIAKFDDDDYYGPFYLNECINILNSDSIDVVGKIKPYYYLAKYKSLYVYNKGIENNYSETVMGSTLCFKKSILEKIQFKSVRYREDFLFNRDCLENNFKIYASSRNNHIVYKFCDNNLHTWQCDIDYLIKSCTLIKSNIEFDQCFSIVDKIIDC